MLVRLFQNLIANAIKFRKNDHPLEISISAEKKDNSYYLLNVKDNGIGLDIKYKDKILQPFGRLHNREKYPGNGIGLAECKKILMAHDSEFLIHSTEGKGSTFSFILEAPTS